MKLLIAPESSGQAGVLLQLHLYSQRMRGALDRSPMQLQSCSSATMVGRKLLFVPLVPPYSHEQSAIF